MKRKIEKILIANRGVPAVRVMLTCRDRKISSLAVYSTPDRLAQHVLMADEAVHIGEAPPHDSYLNMDKIINVAIQNKADAIHPGWGFLAENDEFAEKVTAAGLIWIGPSPKVIRMLGDKIEAKTLAQKAKVPVIPGINNVKSIEQIEKWMADEKVELPIIIKAAAGGGGKGMVKVEKIETLPQALSQAASEAKKSFGDDTLLAEKYIERGKHIEVQIVADEHGNVAHLYERECSMQRRNQKVIEEAPSPSITEEIRQDICSKAVSLMKEIGYTSAGTVEFLYDATSEKFYFLEVNTRLQVEHGVTELITGLDIVGIMIDIALGKKLPFKQEDIRPQKWAIEVRINSEDPKNFNPSFGTITSLQVPMGNNVRVSSGVYEGADIPQYYDSLFMLLMTVGADRAHAISVMDRALRRDLRIEGVKTLQPLLLSLIRHPEFVSGNFTTRFIEQNIGELVAAFKDESNEDEALKIAKYVAEISALGPQKWM